MEPAVYRPEVEQPSEGTGPTAALKIRLAAGAAVVLQLAGIVAVVVGAFELATWFGLVVAGAAALLIGLYVERVLDAHGEGVAHVGPPR